MSISVKGVLKKMSDEGYYLREPETLALGGLLTQTGGVRAMLIEGLPGAGKSALGEFLAKALGGPMVFHLFHAWSDSDELFTGVDVVSAVAGDAENARLPGVLARVATASKTASPEQPVVVVLDEIDKTPERVENLLLDVLQTGRVPLQPGVHDEIVLDNVIFMITSNGMRPLSDALSRRLRRLYMNPLPAKKVIELVTNGLKSKPGFDKPELKGVVKIAHTIAHQVAENEGTYLSPQELSRLVEELVNLRMEGQIENTRQVQYVVAGWAAKSALRGTELVKNDRTMDGLWGVIKNTYPVRG